MTPLQIKHAKGTLLCELPRSSLIHAASSGPAVQGTEGISSSLHAHRDQLSPLGWLNSSSTGTPIHCSFSQSVLASLLKSDACFHLPDHAWLPPGHDSPPRPSTASPNHR